MKKQTPRAKFISEASTDIKKLAGYAYDAMQLASSHDPEHAQILKSLCEQSIVDGLHRFKGDVDIRTRLSKLEIRMDQYEKDKN